MVGAKLEVAGNSLEVTCVSMGNPHAVTYVDQLSDDRVLRIGPKLEELLNSFGVPVFSMAGVEADDVMATLATKAAKCERWIRATNI